MKGLRKHILRVSDNLQLKIQIENQGSSIRTLLKRGIHDIRTTKTILAGTVKNGTNTRPNRSKLVSVANDIAAITSKVILEQLQFSRRKISSSYAIVWIRWAF